MVRDTAAQVFTALRERRGTWLTQGKLAELTGIDPSYISRIERGERSPSLDVLAKLAPAYGLQPVELVRAVYEARLPVQRPAASPMLALAQALEAGPWTDGERSALLALAEALRAQHADRRRAFDRGVRELLAEAHGQVDELLASEGAPALHDWLTARLTNLELDVWGPDTAP